MTPLQVDCFPDADGVLLMAAVLVKVLFFSKAREITKTSEAELSLPASQSTLEALYQALEEEWPALLSLQRTFALALNEEYLENNLALEVVLATNDILAVIPPISGG